VLHFLLSLTSSLRLLEDQHFFYVPNVAQIFLKHSKWLNREELLEILGDCLSHFFWVQVFVSFVSYDTMLDHLINKVNILFIHELKGQGFYFF